MSDALRVILAVVFFPVGAALICWLWIRAFSEKKSDEAERTAEAELIVRTIKRGADRSGRSRLGFNHVLTFRLADGSEVELYSHEEEWGALREGMKGTLTWQGRYFVDLEAA